MAKIDFMEVSLGTLERVMGDRMMVYSYGGHLGNLWYSETKEYVLRLFVGSP
jgi:hypothetical protein